MIKEFNEGRGLELIQDDATKGLYGNAAISDQGENTVSISVYESGSPDVHFTMQNAHRANRIHKLKWKLCFLPDLK